MTQFYILCHGRRAGRYSSLEDAKTATQAHVVACPEGPMRWAAEIKWYGYHAAYQGDWLDHSILVEGGDRGD